LPVAASIEVAVILPLRLLVLAPNASKWAVSYGWPVKPFDQQHPVRGFFGDPRIGAAGGTSFHFGIDVSAADGTSVFAVTAGTVHPNVAGGPQNIAVTSPGVTHGY
jgi:murein DD-endopeptidase MepM/ murein hydrolase activator NlpD